MEHLSLDWTAITEGAGLLGGMLGAIISLWVRSTVNERVDKAIHAVRVNEVEPLKKIASTQHDDIVKLKALCDQQATRADFHQLALQIERALGQMGAMKTSVDDMRDEQKAMRSSVQRVNDYLLNNKVST